MVFDPRHGESARRLMRVNHFLPRLRIMKKGGEIAPIFPLYPEQWRMVDAFLRYQQICIVKPRQMGATTITQGLLFWWAYRAPKARPLDVLTVGHEDGSCKRVNRMLRHYAMMLPLGMRPTLSIDNNYELRLAHNGSTFRQVMAGGRGQGRSYTYQCVVFTEAGKYPRGSAVAGNDKDGDNADEEVIHSTLATVHQSDRRRVIFESTGDGNEGVFKKYAYTAHERHGHDWAFLAFRWFDFAQYALDPDPDFVPDDEELELQALHGLSIPQLAWRRHKLVSEGYTRLRFRREFPEHWEDPFKANEMGAWFDVELLWRLQQLLTPSTSDVEVWKPYEEGRHYGIGVDTAGGKGRDHAVIYVVRDDFAICARWMSNMADITEQARQAVRWSNTYGRATIMTESNRFGAPVIKEIERLGGRTWKDQATGKDWSTQDGPRSSQSKRILYGWGQRLVGQQICCSIRENEDPLMVDDRLVLQLMSIREDDKHRIEAPEGGHDDLADAYLFACWVVRRYHEARANAAAVADLADREQIIRQLAGLRNGY